MKIAIACDHAALHLKEAVRAHLEEQGIPCRDFGLWKEGEKRDYPYASLYACRAVLSGECDYAIVMCGTGIGVSITANKVKGIRCALCSDPLSARLTREHNDSNMLAFGQRIIGSEMAKEIVNVWLGTPFSNGERHIQRIRKVMAIEEE